MTLDIKKQNLNKLMKPDMKHSVYSWKFLVNCFTLTTIRIRYILQDVFQSTQKKNTKAMFILEIFPKVLLYKVVWDLEQVFLN